MVDKKGTLFEMMRAESPWIINEASGALSILQKRLVGMAPDKYREHLRSIVSAVELLKCVVETEPPTTKLKCKLGEDSSPIDMEFPLYSPSMVSVLDYFVRKNLPDITAKMVEVKDLFAVVRKELITPMEAALEQLEEGNPPAVTKEFIELLVSLSRALSGYMMGRFGGPREKDPLGAFLSSARDKTDARLRCRPARYQLLGC